MPIYFKSRTKKKKRVKSLQKYQLEPNTRLDDLMNINMPISIYI